MTIVYFIIALGILVAIHEFGHFAVAKLSGIGVEVFSIGFGPKIISFRKGETEYRIAVIPLGGYVKMVGEDPSDTAAARANPEKAYSRKPLRARLATVFAGPAMNLVLALFLLPIVFWVGKKEPEILQKAPFVMGVVQNSPAAAVHLQKGDRVLRVDEQSVETWGEVVETVLLSPEKRLSIELDRNGETIRHQVLLGTDPYSNAHIGFLGIEPHYFIGNDPVVGKVMPGTPAELMGLVADDRIVAIDGRAIETWTALVQAVGNSNGEALRLGILRQGEIRQVTVKPMSNPGEGFPWILGVQKRDVPQSVVVHRYAFPEALHKGLVEMKRLTGLTFYILKRLFSFDLSYKSLGGPIQIAAASGQAARSGLGEFLYFMAFLSLQLGILNLLPIPVLDGGHLAFMAVEAVIRREIPIKIKIVTQQLGMVLLLALMLLVTVNDINSVWGFKKIMESVLSWF